MKVLVNLISIVFLLSLVPNTIFAQTLGNNNELSLANHVSLYKNNYRVSSTPQFVFTNTKRSLAVGPIIMVYSKVGYQTMPKLTGLRATYKLLKGSSDRNLSFYIGNDIILQRISDQWDAVAFDETLAQYKTFRYRNTELLLEYHIGYGFKLKIGKHWHLSQGVGAGIYMSNLNGKAVDKNAPSSINTDYRGYKNFGVTWNVQLSIGFSL